MCIFHIFAYHLKQQIRADANGIHLKRIEMNGTNNKQPNDTRNMLIA